MQPNGRTIYLVSCVSQKQEQACAARDLYVSNLFRKARRFAEASGCPWFILSAEYGLEEPGQVISPYERTLNTMRASERRAWGERNRECLARQLASRGVEVSVPMEGLRIGEQLSWLGQHSPQPSVGGRTVS